MVSKKDQDKIKRLFEEVNEKTKTQDYEGCLVNLDKIISIDSQIPEVWFERGSIKILLGQPEDAINDLDEAISLKPDYSGALINRGYAKLQIEQYEEAITDFDEVIRINPDSTNAWNGRGNVKQKLRLFEVSIKDFDQAITLKQDDDEAWKNRGNSNIAIRNFKGAIKDFDQAIKINAADSNAWNGRAIAKMQLGQFESAIKDFDETIRLKSDTADAWNSRGAIKLQLGHYEDAIKDFDEAIRLNPTNETAIYNRAAARAEMNANKVLEERFGAFQDTTEKIYEEIETLEKNYQRISLWRLIGIIFLFILIALIFALKFFSPLILPLFCNENNLCTVISNESQNTGYFDVNFFSMVQMLGVITSLSIPVLIFLKITSRDAEEAKVLIQDYKRHADLRTLLLAWRINFKTEKREELFELLIKSTMTNSPVDTLLKLKQKQLQQPNTHPMDDVLEACKNFVKGKDNSPNP